MKVLLTRFWPLGIIFLVWFVFASPYFLKGKVPFPSSYQVNNFAPWSAYPQFAGPVKNGAMPDLITQIYPWKFFTISTLKKGEIPFWNPYSFSGTPHVANYQSAVLSPFNLLFFIFPFVDSWSILILLQPLLAGIFMYLFIKSISVSKVGSVISAISFMFCGFITVWMDYGTLAYAILFLPLALFAIEKFKQKGAMWFLVLLSATFPLSFFSGHFQTSIYFFLLVIVYAIFAFFKSPKQLWTIFLFEACGVLFILPQILPSMEFYQQSIRSGLYSGVEVIPWAYLPTFFAPDFLGNPVTRNDWFGHYAEWNAYIGLLPLLLAYISLTKRNKYIIFFTVTAVVTFLLAFPTPLLAFVVALHLPVLSTSAASRIIVLCSFSLAILAGFGYDRLKQNLQEKNFRVLGIWLGGPIGIFIILWAIVLGKLFIPVDHIAVAKQNLALPTILLCLIMATTILSIFLYSTKQKKLFILIPFLFLSIVAFDMLRFATKWQAFDPKQLVFPSVGATNYFATIKDTGRAVGKLGAQVGDYYGISLLDGYDPLYISRYGIFITSLQSGAIDLPGRSEIVFPVNGIYADKAINLLNGVYIIHKVSDSNMPWTYPYWKYPANRFEVLFDDNNYRIYKNKNAFPQAFLVGSYVVKNNQADILRTMFANSFDLRKSVVLETDPKINQQTVGGSVVLQSQTANTKTYMIISSTKNILFTSVPFYPGWRAFIDRKETNIFRADFAFQAIVVSSGRHTVVFSFWPQTFTYGLVGSGIGLVGICILFFVVKLKKTH